MFPLSRVDQIALVVRDLDAVMRRYWETLGVGPWKVYTYGPPLVREMTYHGRRQDYRMRLALAQAGAQTIELIQPLSPPNIYADHLDRKGEGLHHLGVFVPALDEAVADAQRRGFAVLQSGRGYGRLGDGGFAYLDTEALFGVILELIEIPRERVPPEAEYPPR
ncbi:MAG TPA: VOC family protein [bacterium]|nr:VOC family protein [bacterium]